MTDANDFEYVVKQVGGVAGDKILVKDWVGYAEGVAYPIDILPGLKTEDSYVADPRR